jgi:hypothetical protein
MAAAQRTGQSAATPALDWTAQAPASALFPAPTARNGAPWASDFVNNLGRSEEEANPNSKMKIKLPAAVKVSPAISIPRRNI